MGEGLAQGHMVVTIDPNSWGNKDSLKEEGVLSHIPEVLAIATQW